MYHNLCGENEVPETVDKGIHDSETACEAQSCNAALAVFDPNACSVVEPVMPSTEAMTTMTFDNEAVTTSPASGTGRSSIRGLQIWR